MNKISGCLCILLLLFSFEFAFPQEENPYGVVWTSAPGDTALGFSGESVNTSINIKLGLRAGFDFDNDGNHEFLTSLQSNNETPGRDNNLYLFEADGDNNYSLRWSYQVKDIPFQRNGLAVADLDENGNPEIIWIVDHLDDEMTDNVLFFEYDPAIENFPEQPTATWNTPRNDAGTFRCEVDLKVLDIDNDGRLEIIFNSLDGIVIASLSSADFTSPAFQVEYSNFNEFYWTTATVITDLDNSGTNELVSVGSWGIGGFNILEAIAQDFYILSVNLSLSDLPGSAGCYNAMTAADLDGNGFPEIYYADTNGNFRSLVTNGSYNTIAANNFNLLGTAGSEVLTLTSKDSTFYLATSSASEIFQIDYLSGDVTDSLNYQFTEIFADTTTTPAGSDITIFRIAGAMDLDGDGQEDIVFAAAHHDDTRPTLYVIESKFATSVKDVIAVQIPDEFVLEQNYPNPFNPVTRIAFNLPIDKRISLKIYNSLGQEVRTLIDNETFPDGPHTVQWDATDNHGNTVASGIYIYTLIYGNFSKSRTLTLTR